jgi:acyl-CoA reductase-like NAD-dependent aldehyde dehydrogenase
MTKETETVTFVNPATGEQFGQVPMATEAEIVQATEEMRRAAEIWGRKAVKERVRILRKFQALIIDEVDAISEAINLDTGKSRQDGMIEVFMLVDRMHRYYKRARRWLGRKRVPPGLYLFKRYYTEPQPYGVVLVIGPWNYPFELMVSPLCSALLAGNTVLLKPSEVAGATGVLLEQLIQQVPALSPFVRVLHGDGRVGAALVKAKPDLIFLTGSTKTGHKVARMAAENLTPYLFELGGKDAMIVLEDADIEAAARWGTWGSYYNTGQSCISIERVYVVESVYEAFLQASIAATKAYTLGYSPDLDNPNDLGPLTFEKQKGIIQDHLRDAVDKGARIVTGGDIDGLFMEPAIVVNVDHSMKLMTDETFGPIMPVMKVKDEAEAIRLTNDCDYGLSASVWSNDHKRAQRVARELEVGSVNVNDNIVHYAVPLLPFGGRKKSGLARTHGKQEVLQFTLSQAYAVGRPPLKLDLAVRLRNPRQYWLGTAIMRLMFGVGLRQKLEALRKRRG